MARWLLGKKYMYQQNKISEALHKYQNETADALRRESESNKAQIDTLKEAIPSPKGRSVETVLWRHDDVAEPLAGVETQATETNAWYEGFRGVEFFTIGTPYLHGVNRRPVFHT